TFDCVEPRALRRLRQRREISVERCIVARVAYRGLLQFARGVACSARGLVGGLLLRCAGEQRDAENGDRSFTHFVHLWMSTRWEPLAAVESSNGWKTPISVRDGCGSPRCAAALCRRVRYRETAAPYRRESWRASKDRARADRSGMR